MDGHRTTSTKEMIVLDYPHYEPRRPAEKPAPWWLVALFFLIVSSFFWLPWLTKK
ncbi:hypothetical protein KW786_00265 [Candidatus Parcubacteria bacterium]|nr:hypothetical protein [Candidatus Parcubacteria bacterium]